MKGLVQNCTESTKELKTNHLNPESLFMRMTCQPREHPPCHSTLTVGGGVMERELETGGDTRSKEVLCVYVLIAVTCEP